MNSPLRTPVAIVGGGPVGLVLALFLDRHGVRSVVFELAESTSDQPRGSTHSARSMEHYRRLGLAGEIRELGLPWDHSTDIAFYTRYNGFRLARNRRPAVRDLLRQVASGPRTAQVPEPMHRANQMYVERLLYRRARAAANIELRFGWRVTGIATDPGGVDILAEDTGGRVRAWRAGYVAGCDGARGVVRGHLGARYAGAGRVEQEVLGGRTVAAHLRIPTLYRDFLVDGGAWSHWAVNTDLVLNLIALNGKDEFFLLTSSVDPDSAPDDALISAVRLAAGAPIPVTVLGRRPWTSGMALVADSFGTDQVFLAGDAAHLFTPNGGFGMNTGLDDAANLAWKLAAAVQGWGGPGLLASYHLERRPIAIRNTGAARELNLGLANVARPHCVEQDTAEGKEERRRLGRMLADYGDRTLDTLGVQLGARYDGSPIVDGQDTPPADSLDTYSPSSVPGGRAPHLWLDDERATGSSLFDHFGLGFTLLRLGPKAPPAVDLRAEAARRNIPLKVLDLPDPLARDLYERDLVLIRPDQHVAWRGNGLERPDRLLTAVTGGR
ncbi:monooxygenase [Amycolatopsis sp. WAC 04182]|uniref:FAD-dependent monooxygenase n=1 Tax=Amycolatopsis sp. WAC 04182 TaxID=2203198 RepID=UPI000F791459|nr:FAD-dependent monooxygenase [Amycolatopsis sp. WAC 04182]RSN62636.1 monooxygenase [Amycolatopsis sp. WAC 04182]